MHGVGVYFVWPLSSAALAASLIKPGVSKSGSPAPKPTTSTPAFFMAPALALTARVMESATSFIRSARGNIFFVSPGKVAKAYEGGNGKASYAPGGGGGGSCGRSSRRHGSRRTIWRMLTVGMADDPPAKPIERRW